MIIFGILMGAVLVALSISWSNILEIRLSQIDMEAFDVLDKAAGKINTVWIQGDGFSTNVTLPEKIGVLDYSVRVHSNYVIISTEYKNYTRSLLTPNVTGSLQKGSNFIENIKGNVTIS
jgi:hypothetical protein